MLEKIIYWCNINTGFATILLSTLTLIVSIVAIFVSINTARLPYKKKLLLVSGSFISGSGIGIHITVTNIGNRPIRIATIGFKIKSKVYIQPRTLSESQIMLNQGETTSQYFVLEDFTSVSIPKEVDDFARVYAYVEDSEGKKYKKYVSTYLTFINAMQ